MLILRNRLICMEIIKEKILFNNQFESNYLLQIAPEELCQGTDVVSLLVRFALVPQVEKKNKTQ